MARAQTETFGQFQILVGDGQPDEEFAVLCGLTSKGVQRTASTNSTVVPDCDDEDLPGYEEQDVASISVTISGSGVWARQNHQEMLDWYYSASRKNVKIRNAAVEAGETEFEQGPAILTQLNQTGERGSKVQGEIAIAFVEQPARVAKTGLQAPANTLLPSISGIAIEGGTLTALNGSWTGNPASFTYQWQHDDSGWANIVDATEKTYTPGAGDVGKAIRVIVTAVNATGSTPATSAPTGSVLADE